MEITKITKETVTTLNIENGHEVLRTFQSPFSLTQTVEIMAILKRGIRYGLDHDDIKEWILIETKKLEKCKPN